MKLDLDIIRQLLNYDPDTGKITWRSRDQHWFKSGRGRNAWNAKFADKVAGHIRRRSDGYTSVQIRLAGKLHYAHRLIWMLMTGMSPPVEIDHLDGDATNNAWKNIRDGDSSTNRTNVPKYSNNTSGVCGVQWHGIGKCWMARVQYLGKSHYLGLFHDIGEAEKAVNKFRAEHGFTARHGRDRKTTRVAKPQKDKARHTG